MARYIASSKYHPHRFAVAANLTVADLPLRDHSVAQSGWVQSNGYPYWLGPCSECGQQLDLVGSYVAGKYSAKKKCDAACASAYGSYCACDCRGENHGRAWEAV